MAWNPHQYLKFAQPRFRPAQDLLARVEKEDPKTIYDLGCGAGNVTKLLAARWEKAKVTGIDSSPEMLDKAMEGDGDITWRQSSIAEWEPEEPADLIFSNAALHWLSGHDILFPKLMGCLAPGGVLAVQMPRNFSAPSHTLITQTILSDRWRSKLEHRLRPLPVAEPHFYYDLIVAHSTSVDIWETEYLQVLDGENPVKEWTKGTWLKQLLDTMDDEDRVAFEDDYARRVEKAYPRLPSGKTLFPFRRLFILATK